MSAAKQSIACIGLGRMGTPMAVNILQAGFQLAVFDLRGEMLRPLVDQGARAAGSPKDAAAAADIVALIVVDDAQVESVLLGADGVFAGARPGAIVAIHSTVLPQTVRRLAELGAERGIHVIDAPVSGGEAGVRDKALAYMVGGDIAILEACRPLFETSAAEIFHMGPLGAGAAAKALVQIVTCINMLAAHEAEAMAAEHGLDFALVQKMLHKSAAQSFVIDNWLHRFKLADDPMTVRQRRVEVFQKSLGPALEMARELGVELEGSALAQRLMPQMMGIVDRVKP